MEITPDKVGAISLMLFLLEYNTILPKKKEEN